MKKLSAILVSFMFLLASCSISGTGSKPADNPALILHAVLDSIFRLSDSTEAASVLNMTSEETRGELVALANQYYLSLNTFSEEQCASLASKLIEKTAEIVEYRSETTELGKKSANITVWVKGLDSAEFNSRYDELFLQYAGTGELTVTERAMYSHKSFIAALDNLTQSETEVKISVQMESKFGKWRVLELDKLIQKLFKVMIGAEAE